MDVAHLLLVAVGFKLSENFSFVKIWLNKYRAKRRLHNLSLRLSSI